MISPLLFRKSIFVAIRLLSNEIRNISYSSFTSTSTYYAWILSRYTTNFAKDAIRLLIAVAPRFLNLSNISCVLVLDPCDSIQITLSGGALFVQGHVQGVYWKSTTVNGKPSWTKGPYALWWSSNGIWMVGYKDYIGGTAGWLYSSVSGQPYGNTNDWFYHNGIAWVNPIGEIDVELECTTESGK